MKCMVRSVDDHGDHYDHLLFVCPGCIEMSGGSGLHALPITGDGSKRPTWTFDGNLEAPTLSPSILSYGHSGTSDRCHSFLQAGIFNYLSDCTHKYAGQSVPMPDLPDWVE